MSEKKERRRLKGVTVPPRKNTVTASGAKVGMKRRLSDEERARRYEEGFEKFKRRKKLLLKDPAYRTRRNQRRKEQMEILRREAEFGRIAQTILQYLGSMMFEVGKPVKPLDVEWKNKTNAEILANLKRPFTPQEASEYWELTKAEMAERSSGHRYGRKKRR